MGIAQRRAQAIRGGDLACRDGGDELVVVLTDCALDTAAGRSEPLRRAIPPR